LWPNRGSRGPDRPVKGDVLVLCSQLISVLRVSRSASVFENKLRELH
jgi:hypothetical protein